MLATAEPSLCASRSNLYNVRCGVHRFAQPRSDPSGAGKRCTRCREHSIRYLSGCTEPKAAQHAR